MTLTVACVFVRGHVPFTPEYVQRLKSMAKRHLPPHRFVCLTDRPVFMGKHVEAIKIRATHPLFGWWAKLQLFNSSHQFSGRMLYLDLDVLIVRDLSPVVDYPAPFALAPCGAPGFQPVSGHQTVKRFNSSVMAWNAGEQNHLWDDWTPDVARRLWGDQDWIGERSPNAAAMPASWFPRLSAARPPWDPDAKVILCKQPKNLKAARRWPWFRQAWR
jgi:hypothetical protein